MAYNEPTLDEPATMDVHINTEEQTIKFHMLEQGNLADVDTIEDYGTGFAASRVSDEEACYIRKLNITMDEAIRKAEELAASGLQEYQGSEEVLAIPAEDVDAWAGDRIVRFCGDFPIYKLVKTEEDVEVESRDINALAVPEERQVSVVFRKCFFFFFFFRCITTTITIPTGTTIIFFLFG